MTPYIPDDDRKHVNAHENELFFDNSVMALAEAIRTLPSGKTGGALNYAICRLAVRSQPTEGYNDISNMCGHIASAEHELRRVLLDPYEDKAIQKNGDLPEFINLKKKLGIFDE